jgi:hypothetical protein
LSRAFSRRDHGIERRHIPPARKNSNPLFQCGCIFSIMALEIYQHLCSLKVEVVWNLAQPSFCHGQP